MNKPPLRRIIHNIAQKIKRGISLYFRKVKPLHQASREELLRLLPSVELPECVKQPLYEAGVMRALEDYEEEGVLTGYEIDPNAFTVGTPGNTPASVAAITAVRKEMNDNKVPMAGRMAVLDTAADAKLLELDAFNSVGHTGETSAIYQRAARAKVRLRFLHGSKHLQARERRLVRDADDEALGNRIGRQQRRDVHGRLFDGQDQGNH